MPHLLKNAAGLTKKLPSSNGAEMKGSTAVLCEGKPLCCAQAGACTGAAASGAKAAAKAAAASATPFGCACSVRDDKYPTGRNELDKHTRGPVLQDCSMVGRASN